MGEVRFFESNIANHEADGLISTGNIYLNMSGGVNGELLHQGGKAMQQQLHTWLKKQSLHYVEPGFAMVIGPEPFAFKCIVYTVAVDGFYGTNDELVKTCLRKGLAMLAEAGCRSAAVPALATGYGPLKKEEFGRILREFLDEEGDFGMERIDVVCERDIDEVRKGWGNTDSLKPSCGKA